MSATGLAEVGELDRALSVDQHGIEPIPDRDRDSTAWQQFWIWFGANMAPLQWVVGAIGPQLGLSLVQSIVIMAVGQAAGALIFGVFTLMGKRTGVSQFALGRMAFGRRGNNVPSIINGLITLAWIGIYTYIVLDLATYCLHELGLPDNHATEYGVAAVIMIVQLVVGTLGFYAIRTFEKWTVPVLGAVMAVMTVLAFSKGHIVWNHSTVHGSGLIIAATELMTVVGIGWGFGWSAWASDYSRFTRRDVTEKRLYWASALGTFIPLIWLGVLGAAMASSSTNSDPAELVASLFGVMTIPVLLVIIHGAVAGNIQCVYSAPLCFLAGGIRLERWVGSIVSGVIASAVLVAFLGSTSFATSFTNYMSSFVIWTAAWGVIVLIDFFVLNRGRADVRALYAQPETSRYGDIRWRSLAALLVGLIADGRSSTAAPRCSRVRSRAPPAEWTSRGWRRSCSAGWRIGGWRAPSRSAPWNERHNRHPRSTRRRSTFAACASRSSAGPRVRGEAVTTEAAIRSSLRVASSARCARRVRTAAVA